MTRGVMGRIDIITGTLGKALGGASGGFTSGKKAIIDMLRQKSRPYLFSNTLAPAITGASIAVEFAARHPRRCAFALADGFAVFPRRYSDEELARYLEPIVPAWDGTHLVRLWFRYRDQHVFWPWNRQGAAARSDADVPDLDFLHRGVVELLEAGDDYRIGYAAPFRHRALDVIPDLEVPVCFGNRPGDSMYLTRPLYPRAAWQEVMPREPQAAALAERDILLRYPARGIPPPARRCAPLPGRTTPDYVDIGGTQLFVRSAGTLQGAAPLLVIPHAHEPGDFTQSDPELERLVELLSEATGALG